MPNRLSTGQPNTLGSYLDNCKALGLNEGVAFFEQRIYGAPNGRDEPVVADESQVMYVIAMVEKHGHDRGNLASLKL